MHLCYSSVCCIFARVEMVYKELCAIPLPRKGVSCRNLREVSEKFELATRLASWGPYSFALPKLMMTDRGQPVRLTALYRDFYKKLVFLKEVD